MQTAIDGHHAAHDSGTRTAPRPAPEDHRGPGLTRTAVRATLHCLTGCAIGEIAGLAIGGKAVKYFEGTIWV